MSYTILHYFRNCSTHRDLIHFLLEQSWVEINQTTREIRLVKERQEQEGFYYYNLDKGYWIHLPEDVIGKMDNRLLLEVLDQLFKFVQRITSKLLSSALLLSPPSPYTHLTPCNVQPFPRVSLSSAFKNYRALMNEFNQKITLLEMQVNKTPDEPRCVNDKSQRYKFTFKLHIVNKGTGGNVLKLSSHEHEEVGKDKVKEAAVKEVMEECISLGIIETK